MDIQFDSSNHITINNLKVTNKGLIEICKMQGFQVEENVVGEIWVECDKCKNGTIKEKTLRTVITTDNGGKIVLTQ